MAGLPRVAGKGNQERQVRALPAWAALLALVAIGLAVWANSFSGVFLFDDDNHITPITGVDGLLPEGDGLGARRLVVRVSLALNYALGGLDPTGYHAINLLVHLLAGTALFALVRGTLELSRPSVRGTRATGLALAAAAIWLVHPLQTESVTYVIQRSESMMGLFYLGTLVCLLRSAGSPRPGLWAGAAGVCCALGMATKAVMITAPVMALLYDRVFLAGSFRVVFLRRWALHAALASTWAILAVTGVFADVFGTSSDAVLGFALRDISLLEYLRTQPEVLAHYLRLSVWPDSLCLDYGWPVAERFALIPTAGIAALGLGTFAALRFRPGLGFLGAWFFLTLAPTSSFVPVNVLAFEHRMYLPLAAIAVSAVLGGAALAERAGARRWVALVAVCVVVAGLGLRTHGRNRDYTSDLRMWESVVELRPENARARGNLGLALKRAGRIEEAIAAFRAALGHQPNDPRIRDELGTALYQTGRVREAIEELRLAVRLSPQQPEPHGHLGIALVSSGAVEEGVTELRAALAIDSGNLDAHLGLGVALGMRGEYGGAIEHFRRVLELEPGHVAARQNLEAALARRSGAGAAGRD